MESQSSIANGWLICPFSKCYLVFFPFVFLRTSFFGRKNEKTDEDKSRVPVPTAVMKGWTRLAKEEDGGSGGLSVPDYGPMTKRLEKKYFGDQRVVHSSFFLEGAVGMVALC